MTGAGSRNPTSSSWTNPTLSPGAYTRTKLAARIMSVSVDGARSYPPTGVKHTLSCHPIKPMRASHPIMRALCPVSGAFAERR